MIEKILQNIEEQEAEKLLRALHSIAELSPQSIAELYRILETEKKKTEKKKKSGIFHHVKKEITKIKFDLASYIYF